MGPNSITDRDQRVVLNTPQGIAAVDRLRQKGQVTVAPRPLPPSSPPSSSSAPGGGFIARARVTPARASGGIIGRLRGTAIVQDGPASFTDGVSPSLSSSGMSAQNQQAFNNLGERGARETAAYMAMQEREQSGDLDYGDLGADVANLKQLGFNRAERLQILRDKGAFTPPGERGFIQRARKAELQGLETKNRGAALGLKQADMLQSMVDELSTLDSTNPRRQQLIESILAAQGKAPTANQGTNSAQKYDEMRSMGYPDNVARGLAYGSIKEVRDGRGNPLIVDVASGQTIGGMQRDPNASGGYAWQSSAPSSAAAAGSGGADANVDVSVPIIAVNPQTGERIRWNGSDWEALQ